MQTTLSGIGGAGLWVKLPYPQTIELICACISFCLWQEWNVKAMLVYFLRLEEITVSSSVGDTLVWGVGWSMTGSFGWEHREDLSNLTAPVGDLPSNFHDITSPNVLRNILCLSPSFVLILLFWSPSLSPDFSAFRFISTVSCCLSLKLPLPMVPITILGSVFTSHCTLTPKGLELGTREEREHGCLPF